VSTADTALVVDAATEEAFLIPTRRDYRFAFLWATVGLGAMVLPALAWAPVDLVPALLGMAAVLGYAGYIDARTKTIPDWVTVTAFAVGFILLVIPQLGRGFGEPVLLTAAASAVGIFAVMVVLIFTTGFASGGDIKFAPAPAAVLAVISPLIAVIWLGVAFILSLAAILIRMQQDPSDRSGFPMAPLMALAFPIALYAGFLTFP
jgi:prepilin signal peptidase PulO-like enzyme (type II secretory pathway)